MEKLLPTLDGLNKGVGVATVSEPLIAPFQPVEVCRPMGPYGRKLDLKPGIRKAPNPEFLVRLIAGHASHQAYVRSKAGRHFKNLENLIRGRHKVSVTTKQLLARTLDLSIQDLDKLGGSAPDAPLIPELLATFRIAEGIRTRIVSGLLRTNTPCACCGRNLLDDVDAWWSKRAPGMGPAEYHFAE